MPRIRQQTNVLALKGAFKHNPNRGRERASEPEPVGDIGEPPEGLTAEIEAAWRELVKHAHAGTLCSADRMFMLYAAKVWLEIKESYPVDPKVGIRFEQVCGRLGMTPADRSKVSVVKSGKAASPLDEFAQA